nr:uncharacterized protein LOC127305312 [Lolium perenne]XP_051191680.1 uncharacterized protein LOC127305312 [Lolium perenne]
MRGELENIVILSGGGVREDSMDNYGPHILTDEVLEVIEGANGTPVLLITSSDGRLSAIAMNGVQTMQPTTNEVNGSTEKKLQDFRAWMLLIMSLIATVTFTAGLTPPGGFWSEDKDGNEAGTSIMRKKFPTRWAWYHGTNTMAFCSSLMTIATLAINFGNKKAAALRSNVFPSLVSSCFMSLAGSYISGTWENRRSGVSTIIAFVLVLVYIPSLQLFVTWRASCRTGEQPTDTNNL